jgi:hypothetical protein
MQNEDDVSRFLSHFFPKMEIWGIYFLDRDKNIDALKELAITPGIREQIIRSIQVDDFVETVESLLSGFGEMWVFGKDYYETPLYIKIALGQPKTKQFAFPFTKQRDPFNTNSNDGEQGDKESVYRGTCKGNVSGGDHVFPWRRVPGTWLVLHL